MASRFDEVMARKGEIMVRALGMDYREFERRPIAFDYDAMMAAHGYSLDDIVGIQRAGGVGNTPLLELRNLTDLVRSISEPGHGRPHLREGRGRQHGRLVQGPPGQREHPRRAREGLRGRHRGDLGQLRRRGLEPGGAREPELHHLPGGVRLAATSASRRSSRSRASARRSAPRS